MYHFLVNRVAGNGRGGRAWKQIKPLLEQEGIPYCVSYPCSAEEAVNHVRSLHQAVTTLVVVGGDGTIQSVLADVSTTKLQLGIIPAGSGNDVARGLHIPLDAPAALRHLLRGTASSIDIIRLGGKCFATAIGAGFDGAIAFAANQSAYKRWLNRLKLGRLTYVFALVQVLFHYRPTTVCLTLDGSRMTLENVWLVAAANFPSYGGGMNICPAAKWNDGYLEVCVVQNVTRFELLRSFPKIYSGKHVHHPAFRMFQAKHVKIESRRPMLAHGDGELAGITPLNISLHSAKARIVSMYQQASDPHNDFPADSSSRKSLSSVEKDAASRHAKVDTVKV